MEHEHDEQSEAEAAVADGTDEAAVDAQDIADLPFEDDEQD